ncbi:P2 family phage major capsid protein, partial [Salmonella enterica subsp. enterica serovar Typhimurium]|uniref:P2 family phage major capsid protein n=1 Tax=Salmonella enterica TaxID=28901 RepID=UPI002611CF20
DVEYQDDDELVVVCGRELLSDKYFPLVNKEQDNSEKIAADLIISQKRMGDVEYQDDDELVVVCGRELLSDKYFPLVNKEQD